jgi:hypothetical protein
MDLNTWAQISLGAGLPHDAEPLIVKKGYAVARSTSRRLVFRIGLRGERSFDLNPSDVGFAHKIAVEMAESGLNVLAPTERIPEVRGPYLISASPLATPLVVAGWSRTEATHFGGQLRSWCSYKSPLLTSLNIPGYVVSRARQARLTGGEVAAAGEWCMNALAALESQTPFSQLAGGSPGAIHGDVHPGNLVRHRGRILLIDLDSVKTGPAMFDLAVGLMYERRYNNDYPGTTMACGYLGPDISQFEEELTALQNWKELSSYSQLLLRWHQSPAVAREFWQRTRSKWNDKWNNIVRTPTPGTIPKEVP